MRVEAARGIHSGHGGPRGHVQLPQMHMPDSRRLHMYHCVRRGPEFVLGVAFQARKDTRRLGDHELAVPVVRRHRWQNPNGQVQLRHRLPPRAAALRGVHGVRAPPNGAGGHTSDDLGHFGPDKHAAAAPEGVGRRAEPGRGRGRVLLHRQDGRGRQQGQLGEAVHTPAVGGREQLLPRGQQPLHRLGRSDGVRLGLRGLHCGRRADHGSDVRRYGLPGHRSGGHRGLRVLAKPLQVRHLQSRRGQLCVHL
mmetsp:Transcript_100153/g.172949  ORF Transcript_100153/g.172949 Transcript_100153/m.172949 type:complete len:251 (+) Transcript_100153:1795-2547(+)